MAESLLRIVSNGPGYRSLRCSEFFDKTARARARSDELRYLSRCRFYGTQFLNPLHLLVLFEFLHQSARGRVRAGEANEPE